LIYELKVEALAAISAKAQAADGGDDGDTKVGAADSDITPAREV
jgi:hypothetical protein